MIPGSVLSVQFRKTAHRSPRSLRAKYLSGRLLSSAFFQARHIFQYATAWKLARTASGPHWFLDDLRRPTKMALASITTFLHTIKSGGVWAEPHRCTATVPRFFGRDKYGAYHSNAMRTFSCRFHKV
ncbi:hypothetical protein K466DRAFT_386001 [Polyporus arcularius HHB13444]|uniref:Uncharacterized protein n=1 Tax=Polyporus arcularius HHB13444 TaxID=1314778 RepID=A0A5C3PWF0_9APHY|nr:hypothetical protein K466DRAFT_386001 [Polyporus arcularius HHB13444]